MTVEQIRNGKPEDFGYDDNNMIFVKWEDLNEHKRKLVDEMIATTGIMEIDHMLIGILWENKYMI